MALVWNEIKPIDGFRVSIKSLLSHSQHKTLTHLYQPLIGSLSYALYLTLFNEVEGERLFSVEKNHQWLMSLMNDSLNSIYHARLRLEALGLLKTYLLQKDEEQTVFEYELLHPFSPEQFFADDLLSICLYNQVGAHRYRELRMRYSSYYVANGGEKLEKQEVTKEFHQVFSSLSPSELVAFQGSEMNEQFDEWTRDYPLRRSQFGSATLKFDQYELDIEALKGTLMKGLGASSIINQHTIPTLKKIAYFYQLDEWSLGRIIQDSLNQEDELDLDLLREQAKEWYRFQEGGQPPAIRPKSQLQEQEVLSKNNEPLTEEEQHLLQLEQISPLQLLEQFQRGGKVADPDVKLVEELLFEYKLKPAVINLLLEYIFYTNNYKLPRNLVTKVAAHWKRFNVQTIHEAQTLALKEQKQYKEWQSKQEEKELEAKRTGSPPRYSTASKSIRKDKLPPWIEAQQQQEQEEIAPLEEENLTDASSTSEKRRQRIQQRLKNLEKLKQERGGVK